MKYFLKISLVFILSVVIFCGARGKTDQPVKKEPALNLFPPAVWKPGDWWIVQTRFVANQAKLLDEPEKLGFFSYYHLFQVAGKDTIAGSECMVIDIRPFNIPAGEQNDLGTGYLWRLYCNLSDMSLRRLIIKTRSGPYLIGGQAVEDTIDYSKGNPLTVAGTPVLVPLDIPKMPFQELPPFIPEDERDILFIDECTRQEYHQYINIITTPKKDTVLEIKLWDCHKELRSQVWRPGLPWWSNWHLEITGPFESGIRDASLLRWGTSIDKPSM